MHAFEHLRREIKWTQSSGEEFANSISHGVGLLGAAIGAPVLLFEAVANRGTPFVVGACVYAATMLLLYLGSTLYHAWPQRPFKRVLQVIDHSAIFLLIAGTYTPFMLGPLHGPLGWLVLACVWLLAISGVIMKARRGVLHRPRFMIALCLTMGWLIAVVIQPLSAAISTVTLAWLVAGGVTYTAGVVFFVWEKMRYSHFVWHLFVLGGTACHYLAVLSYANAAA